MPPTHWLRGRMDPATHAELTSHKTMHIHGSMRTSGFGSPHLAMLRRPLGQCHQPGRREDSTAAAPFRSARSPCVSTGLYPRKGVMSAGLYPRKGVMWHLGDVVWTSSTALPPLLSFLCTAAQAAHLQTAITLADFFVNAVTTRFKDNVPDFDLTLRPHVRATSQLQRSIKEQHQRDDASLSSLPTMSCHLFSCALGCYRDPRSTRVARTLLCLRTDRCPLVFQACTWCVALASLAGRPAAQNVSVSR